MNDETEEIQHAWYAVRIIALDSRLVEEKSESPIVDDECLSDGLLAMILNLGVHIDIERHRRLKFQV